MKRTLTALTAVTVVSALSGCSVGARPAAVQLLRTPLGSALLETDAAGRDRAAPAALLLDEHQQTIASRRVGSLRAGETLVAVADIELTDDVIQPNRVEDKRFDVRVSLGLVLGSGPSSVNGVELGTPTAAPITWREHHDTFTWSVRYRVPRSLAGRTVYVNVVAAADLRHPPSACVAPYTRISVACGVTVDRQLDQLAVLRIPPGGPFGRALAPVPVSDASLPAPLDTAPSYGQRQVVWSSPPINVQQGEVIDVTAALLVSAAALERGLPSPSPATTGCNALFSGQLYLSQSRDRLSGSALPALSGDTGFNLTQADPTAEWRQQGIWQAAGASYGRRYVDLVAWASRAEACPPRQVAISAGASRVSVVVYGTRR